MTADLRPPGRKVASHGEWEKIVWLKRGPCRICGRSGGVTFHHIVPRSLGGDDVPENIVPLCGSGTMGCHGDVEARYPRMLGILRANLRGDELRYVLGAKGEDWLDRYYPLSSGTPQVPVGAHEGTRGSAGESESATVGGPSPGSDCPTCNRRIPHPRKKASPVTQQVGLRVPADEVDEFMRLERTTAEHLGIDPSEKRFRYRLYLSAMAVVLSERRADVRGC